MEFLKQAIENNIISPKEIYEAIEMAKSTFSQKYNNKYNFSAKEIGSIKIAIKDISKKKRELAKAIDVLCKSKREIYLDIYYTLTMFNPILIGSNSIIICKYKDMGFEIKIYDTHIVLFSETNNKKIASFRYNEINQIADYIIEY